MDTLNVMPLSPEEQRQIEAGFLGVIAEIVASALISAFPTKDLGTLEKDFQEGYNAG